MDTVFILSIITISSCIASIFLAQKLKLYKNIDHKINKLQSNQQQQLDNLQKNYLNQQIQHNISQQTNITNNIQDIRQQLQSSLQQHSNSIEKPLQNLTLQVKQQLDSISTNVNQRLDSGFNKTNAVFNDIVKRLAYIDNAQQKIQNLTTHVQDLYNLLNDKKSRGAFGETQLYNLINNTIPSQHVKFQHTLSNGKRPDCLLILPQPTGNIAIDAKFPLETFQALQESNDEATTKQLHKQFIQVLNIHINNIAEKYIIKNETANGAIMFIPAESIFAHIHSFYPNLISHAQKSKVWLTSPSTMMAILTTATSVLKDIETQNQVHEIQKHLSFLNQDFQRFKKRMDQLAKHIDQAHTDIKQVHTSADKITKRFNAIENVDIKPLELTE